MIIIQLFFDMYLAASSRFSGTTYAPKYPMQLFARKAGLLGSCCIVANGLGLLLCHWCWLRCRP